MSSRERRPPQFVAIAVAACLLAVSIVWIWVWSATRRRVEGPLVPIGLLLTPVASAVAMLFAGVVHVIRMWTYHRRSLSSATSDVVRAASQRTRDAALVSSITIALATVSTVVIRWQAGAPAGMAIVFGLTTSASLAIGAWLVIREPRPLVIGFLFGEAWCIAVVLGIWLSQLAAFLRFAHRTDLGAMSYFQSRVGFSALSVVATLMTMSLVLVVNLWIVANRTLRGGPSVRHQRGAWFAGIGLAICAAAVVTPPAIAERVFLQTQWTMLTVPTSQPSHAAFKGAVAGLRRMVSCVRDAPREVTDTLDYEGSVAGRQVACLDSVVKAASVRGEWSLQYGLADDPTDPLGFSALAESTDPRQRLLYVTVSGVIYEAWRFGRADSLLSARRGARLDARQPARLPPADGTIVSAYNSPYPQLAALRRCVTTMRYSAADTLDICRSLRPTGDGGLALEIVARDLPMYPEVEARYHAAVSFAASRAFSIRARPRTYGTDGFRSFLLDESGAWHVTSDDRDATTADPGLPACELQGLNCSWGKF